MRAYYNDNDKKVCAWLKQLIKNGDITKGDVDDRSITEITTDDIAGYDRVHLFAGVGTWDYALNKGGWGDRPVISASLPCQPFSAAGKRLGKRDERHLLPSAIKLITASEINTIFGEQVASSEVVGTELEASFVIAVQNGDYAKANKLAKRLIAQKGFSFTSRWVDDLHTEMAKAGYAIGCSVLGAHSVGAPHIRQRLYWVANAVSDNDRISLRKIDGEKERGEIENGEDISKPWKSGGTSRNVCGMADTASRRRETEPDASSAEIFRTSVQQEEQRKQSSDIRSTSVRMEFSEGEQMGISGQSWKRREADAWEWILCGDGKYRPVKPGIQPIVDGTSEKLVCGGDTGEKIDANNTQEAREMRLKGYGNAIHAQTAEVFIRAFMEL